jgi:hypothetical protein
MQANRSQDLARMTSEHLTNRLSPRVHSLCVKQEDRAVPVEVRQEGRRPLVGIIRGVLRNRHRT